MTIYITHNFLYDEMLKINFGLCVIIACFALSMAAPRSKKHSRMLEIPLEGENAFNAMIVETGENPRQFPVETEQPQEPEVTLGEIVFRPNPELFNVPMIGHPIVGPHPGPMALVGTGDFHVTGAEIVDAKKKREFFRKIVFIL